MESPPVVDLSSSNNRQDRDNLADLSAASKIPGLTITPSIMPLSVLDNGPISVSCSSGSSQYPNRRVLRPRTEPRSYVESPDTLAAMNGKLNRQEQSNGNTPMDSDTDDEKMPPDYEVKELSAAEIWERERELRKMREELRNEETKLVLLKKLKHSQQVMKENINKTPANIGHTSLNPLSIIPQSLPKGSLSVTPTNLADYKTNNNTSITRQPNLQDQSTSCFPLPRQSLPGGATLTTGVSSRNQIMHGRNTSNISITPSVTITPTSAPSLNMKSKNLSSGSMSNSVSITPAASISISQNNMSDQNPRDNQTSAQKQAAAKLALRKQLEKTLLQIPPPKPPPPEMHFIPNPSNGEFVYLLGLEHVVDYLTKDKKVVPTPQQPFRCAQCKIDFTPVWKLEKEKKSSSDGATKDIRIICEQCVTTNVKKALKAEHTNRLKTAFVKALQQEQEIEQRIATQSQTPSTPEYQPQAHQSSRPQISHSPAPLTITKSQNSTPRPTPTPPINQSTPPPQSQSSGRSSSSRSHQTQDPMNSLSFAAQLGALANMGSIANLGNLGNLGNFGSSNAQQTAAAMQAFQQQLFRGLQQGLSSNNPGANMPAHMMQFSPLLYSYQLAMAQAAQAAGKGKGTSMADMQRAMELQRQYLEMLPQQSNPTNSRQNNWKNN